MLMFFDAVEIGDPFECWPWKMSIGSHGYGQTSRQTEDGRNTTAHRVAWQLERGPIPQGMTIDHICHNRICQNPLHLRVMPNVLNAMDNGNATKKTCPRGHPYSGSNLYEGPTGGRRCRECARMRKRGEI